MADVLTLRELRDRVRHRLGRDTALDAGIKVGNPNEFGGVGEPHPSYPNPTNIRCNEAIFDTLSDLNIRCRLGGGEEVQTAVQGQTTNGPLVIDLQTAFWPRAAQVNEVERVWWNDGSTNRNLKWTHFRDLDANRIDFTNIPPSVPEQCWTTKYNLFVSPAPASPGTLFAYVGRGLKGPRTDDDTIPQLPADLYHVVWDGAALLICGDQPLDATMKERAALIGPAYERGVEDVKRTFGSMSGYSPRFVALSYRVRRGSR